MKFHVAAYSMSPCGQKWDPRLESEFMEGLKSLPFVAGLEIPHYDKLDRWDEENLFRHAHPDWAHVVTVLPSVSGALRTNPKFGLASRDESGRKAAIESVRVANASVRRANDRWGRRAVRAMMVHSSPTGGTTDGTGGVDAFAASLTEIAGWNWDGAEIVIEHCDAAIPGQAWQKGFLTVEEEIAASDLANRRQPTRIRHALNWGRSAIEGHSRETPARHTALLLSGDRLAGMVFSGAGGSDTPWGVWQDTHMPHAPTSYAPAGVDGALLTEREMEAFFAQTKGADLSFLGVKIAARPLDTPVLTRLELLRSVLTIAATAQLSVS